MDINAYMAHPDRMRLNTVNGPDNCAHGKPMRTGRDNCRDCILWRGWGVISGEVVAVVTNHTVEARRDLS